MKVQYTKGALTDLAAIVDHIHRDDPTAAAEVGNAIQETIVRIASFPTIGSATERADVLVIPARPYAYLIFYTATEEWIIIRYVRHPKRRRPANRRP
jgi:toxin ParE1/3/4